MTMSKRKLQHLCTQSSQAGFTIIESLIAIIIAAILLAAIAPVIVLSTGNRVQARRVELASQAAKAYIDGVSASSITEPPSTDKTINNYDTPKGGTLICKPNAYCSSPSTDLYCIDGDGDGICTNTSTKDLVIQAFRYNPSSTEARRGYNLGLRVYRADAFQDSESLKSNYLAEKDKTGSKATQASFGVRLGVNARKAPLVEMTTEISTQETTFKDFCSRLQNSNNDKSGC